MINLNNSGQMFNSYPLFTFGSLNGFSSSDFTMGSGTKAGYTYGFVQDGTNPNQIDLTITGTGSNNLPSRQGLSWATGSGTWNTTATNWGGSATYVDGDTVTFGEPAASNSVVTISGSAVTPLSLTISNTSNSYTFTGGTNGGITGTTALYKTNAGMATLSTSNSYTGGTFITGGTLATGAAGDLCLGSATGGVTLDTQGTLMTTTSNFSSSRPFTVNAGGGTFLASTGTSSVGGTFAIAANATFTKTGTGTLVLTGTKSAVTAAAGSTISVQAGNLSIVPEGFTENGQFNIASGATLTLNTVTSTTAASTSFLVSSGGVVNGNLVVTNPLGLNFASPALSGTGAIQFQNMQTPPAPTHFSTASAQSIGVTGNYVTQNINCNIQLNSLNQPFYKTSISQSGSTTNGNGFILGNGTACSFFSIYPGAGNTFNINGVISGNCDVQFGGVGGGGQANTVYLNNQNTYTGVTMFECGVGGNLILGASNALPPTTDLIFAPINGNSYQTTVDLAGNNQTVASLSYWANAIAGANSNDWTSLGEQIVNTGAAATLTVSGTVTPSRPFGGVLGDTNNQNLILVKDGPNTLWLNGNYNSYSGGTTVKNGLLLLSPNNTASGTPTGYGDVTVSGGTLQGTATIGSGYPYVNLNVGAAGTVHPGLANSLAVGGQPGTLAVVGNATLSAGANMQFDFGPASTSLLSVSNQLSLPTTGNVTINLVNTGGLSGGTYPLITFGSLAAGNTSTLAVASQPSTALTWSGTTASLSDSGTAINVTIAGSSVWDVNTTADFQGWQTFSNGKTVTFDDSGSGGTVSIASSVAPARWCSTIRQSPTRLRVGRFRAPPACSFPAAAR